MEKQNVSLLRHKSNKKLTVIGIAACLLLSPALSMALFVPQIVALIPVLLMAMLGYAGAPAAAACTAIMLTAALPRGLWAGLMAWSREGRPSTR